MKDGKVYVTELPLEGWRETGIALEWPHSDLEWLERNVSYSDHLALANQWSRDGIHWQYDPPMIGARQRALLLRREGLAGMRAANEIAECWPRRTQPFSGADVKKLSPEYKFDRS